MSAHKLGHCRLCPKDAAHTKLYGDGVCRHHLNHPEDDQSKQRALKEVERLVATEKELREWYRTNFETRPEFCENQCGKRLIDPLELWRQKAMVCHILPKKLFPSVIVHPDNRWFGCLDCHHRYDSAWVNAMDMKVWPLAVERFAKFMNLIKIGELKHLPQELRAIVDGSYPVIL